MTIEDTTEERVLADKRLIRIDGIYNRVMADHVMSSRKYKSYACYLNTDRYCSGCGDEIRFVALGYNTKFGGETCVAVEQGAVWDRIDYDGGLNGYKVTHRSCL